jgi:hypothetical protein
MAKGGGHSKGRKMPYSSIRVFAGQKPLRQGHWNLVSAWYSIRDSLVASNVRGLELDVRIINRATGVTVWQPAKCGVCETVWATDTDPNGDSLGEWSLCHTCAEAVELPEPVRPAAEKTSPAPEAHDGKAALTLKPGTIESALASLRHGLAKGVNAAQAAESAVAIFTPENPLPDADPSDLLTALDQLNLPRAVWADGTVAAVANGMLWRMQAQPHAVTGGPCGVWSAISPEAVRGHFSARGAARFILGRRVP